MKTPFTYYISWTKENLHYYGVRYASGCNPNDLWTKYHTSSRKVKELRESLGEPDIIEVRKTFETGEQAVDWELRVLKRLDVIKRDDWLNECAFPCCDNRGRIHSDETKKKISLGNKGKIISSATRKKMIGNTYSLGHKHSAETRKKMAASRKGFKHSEETKKKISESHIGKKQTYKHNQKISESKKGKPWTPTRRLAQENRMVIHNASI